MPATAGAARTADAAGRAITKLTEQDDIKAYIITFERMMAVYEVPRAS